MSSVTFYELFHLSGCNFVSDMSHSETKLFSFIDGLEVHMYNKSATYGRLEKLFGLTTGGDQDETEENGDNNKENRPETAGTSKKKGYGKK